MPRLERGDAVVARFAEQCQFNFPRGTSLWRFGWVLQVFLGFLVVGFCGVNDGVAVLVVICVVILG